MTNLDEQWKPIPGHPNYQSSNRGRVRSLRSGSPHVLSSNVGPCGFRTIHTYVDGSYKSRRIGTLVALAWIGTPPDGSKIRHLDGDPLNDNADNLAYGTAEEVASDHAARARRHEVAGGATHCPLGHRYEDSWLGNWGERLCKPCRRAERAEEADRRRARDPGKQRTIQRRYRERHREILNERRRRKRSDDPVPAREAERRYREKNPQRRLASAQSYRQRHPERVKESQRKYRERKRAADARTRERSGGPVPPPRPQT